MFSTYLNSITLKDLLLYSETEFHNNYAIIMVHISNIKKASTEELAVIVGNKKANLISTHFKL